MPRSPHPLLLVLASVLSSAAVTATAACGGSSANPVSSKSDGGGKLSDGGPVPDDGGGTEDGDIVLPDGAIVPPDAGEGTWGPCSLASVGDPGAFPIKMVAVSPPSAATACGAATTPLLFQTAQQYETFEASLGAGGAGASVDGGAPYASLIDWSTYSLIVIDSESNDTYTAGAEGVDGDQIILTKGLLCQGVAPQCTEQAFQVPSAATVTIVDCLPPATACTAP
jgi:hypothetical protein